MCVFVCVCSCIAYVGRVNVLPLDAHVQIKVRINAFNANVAAVSGEYQSVLMRVDGNRDKHEMFLQIAQALDKLRRHSG